MDGSLSHADLLNPIVNMIVSLLSYSKIPLHWLQHSSYMNESVNVIAISGLS